MGGPSSPARRNNPAVINPQGSSSHAGFRAAAVAGAPSVSGGGRKKGRSPFVIELDLNELITLEDVGEGKVPIRGTLRSADVFVKAGVLVTDKDRPKRILAIVQKLFSPLKGEVSIQLDTPGKSDRLLKARFGWPVMDSSGKPKVSKRHGPMYDPGFVGAGARGFARSRLEKFKPVKGDEKQGVTAYVFEGAIAVLIKDYFPGKVNVDNIFATSIAHELGHNLGLPHGASPSDIMFVFAGRSEADRKKWLFAAEKNLLKFDAKTQVPKMRNTIRKK